MGIGILIASAFEMELPCDVLDVLYKYEFN
jgi:hypothetical protein